MPGGWARFCRAPFCSALSRPGVPVRRRCPALSAPPARSGGGHRRGSAGRVLTAISRWEGAPAVSRRGSAVRGGSRPASQAAGCFFSRAWLLEAVRTGDRCRTRNVYGLGDRTRAFGEGVFHYRRLNERERIGELGAPEVWGLSPKVPDPE